MEVITPAFKSFCNGERVVLSPEIVSLASLAAFRTSSMAFPLNMVFNSIIGFAKAAKSLSSTSLLY